MSKKLQSTANNNDATNHPPQQQPPPQHQQQQQQQQSPQSSSPLVPSPETREERRKLMMAKLEQNVRLENRVLTAAFGCGLLATFLFLVSFSSEYWVRVTLARPENKYDKDRGRFLKTGHYHGLWRFCRNELWPSAGNATQFEPYVYCRRMTFDVLSNVKPERLDVERKMADFRRSTVAVGIIALVLSSMAHGFTWYSIHQMRYMYKRLAGCLHLITGASCWVVSEVFRQSMMYEEKAMKQFVQQFQDISYGWSYYLVWVAFFLFLIPGVTLLAYSRKRKGRKARSLREADENEPVHLGRI